MFLDQAINYCSKDGEFCLIIPSSDFLYNKNSNKFRTWFLQNHHTPQIIDFTNLSGSLFGNANVSVVALFSKKHSPQNLESISHITVRRNHITAEKLFFELDFYDFHNVPFDSSIEKSFIWKANLFGGGRLGWLLLKLSRFQKLGDFFKIKKVIYGWEYAEGFIIGNKDKISILKKIEIGEISEKEIGEQEVKKLKRDFKKADWLTGKKFIDEDFI